MLFHLSIFFWSIAFFSGLASFSLRDDLPFWSGYLMSVGLLAVVSVITARRFTKRVRNATIPILLAVSAPALFSLIDRASNKVAFSVIAAGMFYVATLALYRMRFAPRDVTARTFLSIATLSALFFFYSAVDGFYLNFAVPLFIFMLANFLGSFGAAYPVLAAAAPGEKRRARFYSAVIALGMTQISWMMSFLPWSYLTVGSLSTICFFILWDMALGAMTGEVSRKRTLAYLVASLALVALLVVTSPWQMQV